MAPRLSVTILNYNYGHYLAECIDSILAQTFEDFELFVIDDCSSDGSVELITSYSDPRVRPIIHEQNLGFLGSLVQGTEELSTGEYVAVVSADDFVVRPDAFERQVAMLDEHPDVGYCFTGFEIIRPGESTQHASFEHDTVLGPEAAFDEILMARGVWPAHSGTVIRRSSYDAVGGYRRDISMPVDLALWFDLSRTGGLAYAAVCGHSWRLHGDQMTTSKTQLNLREIAQVVTEACEQGERAGFGTGGLTRRAIGAHFGAFAVTEAYGGSRREALRRCWAAVRECPVPALTSKRIWVACVRALLGERLTGAIAGVLRVPRSIARSSS
ncbi:MAG: glycosyltransferase family 2 protein [Ilumatobacteraceae bacterium]|nr:glycosyltransferase family 2 protein [Ilumatobacteraceae bacterium]